MTSTEKNKRISKSNKLFVWLGLAILILFLLFTDKAEEIIPNPIIKILRKTAWAIVIVLTIALLFMLAPVLGG